MNQDKLKVIVFTQQDIFFIPTNILKAAKVCNIIEVVDNQYKNSFENKITDMLKWFGFFQCAKMGIYTVLRTIQGFLDVIFRYKIAGGKCSVKHAAKKIKADYRVVEDINDPQYVEHVRKLNPDLIISYSAPQVVKPELLSIPKYGVINVHGALLPEYRGLLPSFWYLYNDEKVGGATVHCMSKAIDDGDICKQGSVDISDCNTMFELLKKTKYLGGELMVDVIQEYSQGKVKTYSNDSEKGSYFTWPTLEQAREFRKKGKRLV